MQQLINLPLFFELMLPVVAVKPPEVSPAKHLAIITLLYY